MKMSSSQIITGVKSVDENMCSWHDPNFRYELGKVRQISARDAKEAKSVYHKQKSCGPGLHFSPSYKDAASYAPDGENFIMLKVQANKKDLLGQDSSKIRV